MPLVKRGFVEYQSPNVRSIEVKFQNLNFNTFKYRIDLYIGPASVDWTSLMASKEEGLEDAMSGIKV